MWLQLYIYIEQRWLKGSVFHIAQRSQINHSINPESAQIPQILTKGTLQIRWARTSGDERTIRHTELLSQPAVGRCIGCGGAGSLAPDEPWCDRELWSGVSHLVHGGTKNGRGKSSIDGLGAHTALESGPEHSP